MKKHHFKRELEVNRKRSFFIFGPRQVGKSTLIRKILPAEESLIFDFLLGEVYIRYSSNPSLFRKEIIARDPKIKYVIVDEIQRLPEILNEIHYILEETESPPVFAMTGSSARKLKKQEANMLGGRASNYSLYPFSYRELGDDFDLDRALNFGLLPAAYLVDDRSALDLLSAYVSIYLEQEIRLEALARNITGFINFLKVSAEHNGELINYSNIARETGNLRHHTKEYFQILEDTLIGFFLYPYASSERKRLAQHPKFYFFDLGVTKALRGHLDFKYQLRTSEYGKSFEQFLILEVIKFSKYQKKNFKLSFYRTNAGAEVDLIIENSKKQVFAIEIKAKSSPALAELKGLFSFAEICPEARLICACLAPNQYQEKQIFIVPWQKLFEILC